MIPADRVDDMLDSKTAPQPVVPGDQGPDMEQPRSLSIKHFVRSIFDKVVTAEANAEKRGKDMVSFFSNHMQFIERNIEPLKQSLEGMDVGEYFNEYYINTLKDYEKRGAVNVDENRVDLETEQFLTWVERQCLTLNKD
jgi:hypothetical protein